MWFVRFASLALVPLLVGPAYGVDITMCGQVVPAGETGVLQADLSGCSRNPGVTVGDGGSVLLNGHSITSTAPGANGIVCEGGCLVQGPGKISVDYGIVHSSHLRRQSLRVEDVDFEDNGGVAVLSIEGFVFARNVTVTGNGFEHVDPSNVTIAVHAYRGLFGKNLTVTNNGGVGIDTIRLKLIDSVVTGNNGWDIIAFRRPRLVHSTCGKSEGRYPPRPLRHGAYSLLPWGVCTGDPPRRTATSARVASASPVP